jgi:hypothetical protein
LFIILIVLLTVFVIAPYVLRGVRGGNVVVFFQEFGDFRLGEGFHEVIVGFRRVGLGLGEIITMVGKNKELLEFPGGNNNCDY